MRQLKDWIDSYMDYHSETESSPIFHKWACLFSLAAALRKKVNLNLGLFRIYPNIYVILVAEPGISRKSQAISYAKNILSVIDSIKISAESTTKEAFLCDLETSAQDETLPDGSTFIHSSINVMSKELESFVGNKKENHRMLALLTDTFDCEELPFKYRTKNSGSNIVPSIFVNLIAATTPTGLLNCFSNAAVGGGLTSRVVFVWSGTKFKKVTYPEETPEMKILKKALLGDLFEISRLVGSYTFTPDARQFWHEWYQSYDEFSVNRICKEKAFDGWYARKPLYIQKVAMLCSVSENSKLVLEIRHFERAIKLIEDTEQPMGYVFAGMGKSSLAVEIAKIKEVLANKKVMKRIDLFAQFWPDLKPSEFQEVLDSLTQLGLIRVETRSAGGSLYDVIVWTVPE